MDIFGMGPLELALILGLALVIFGPDRLPELARQLGRAVSEVRRLTIEANDEIKKTMTLDDPGVARSKRILPSKAKRNDDGSGPETGGI